MQLVSIYIPLSLASMMLCLPATALAVAPLDELPPLARIVGGEESKTCHFPSTVSLLRGGCTGTLVHPRIVITANHCLREAQQNTQVVFGEKSFAEYRVNASCKAMNGGKTAPRNGDFAYCKLERAVKDVPIVPILMGCELAALKKAQEVVLVGFGLTGADNKSSAGTKREVVTPLHDSPGASGAGANEILVGHASKGACYGDSGGPAYINLSAIDEFKNKPGAGWRVFGVTSGKGPGGEPCASTSIYGLISSAVEWIEKDSGFDITPCFDAKGEWKPGADCKHSPDPQAGGKWLSCDAGPLGEHSQVCGHNPLAPSDSESTGSSDSEEDSSITSEGTTDESSEGSSESGGDATDQSQQDSSDGEGDSTNSPQQHDSPSITPEPTTSSPKDATPQAQGDSSGCAVRDKGRGATLLVGLVLGLLGRRRKRS